MLSYFGFTGIGDLHRKTLPQRRIAEVYFSVFPKEETAFRRTNVQF